MFFSALLTFHISAGVIALLSGVAAMIFKKGSRAHRKSGNIFVLSMLIMSSSAAYLALTKLILLSVLGGLMTIYMIATSWMTTRRKKGESGRLEYAALIWAVMVAAAYFFFGIETANTETGLSKDGLPAAAFFVFGGITSFAALFDMRMIYQGSLSRVQRLIRHLWRMCFAMFMATVSLFMGQPQVFPESIRKIEILAVPVVAVMLFTIFWLVKTFLTKTYKRA